MLFNLYRIFLFPKKKTLLLCSFYMDNHRYCTIDFHSVKRYIYNKEGINCSRENENFSYQLTIGKKETTRIIFILNRLFVESKNNLISVIAT